MKTHKTVKSRQASGLEDEASFLIIVLLTLPPTNTTGSRISPHLSPSALETT